MTFQMNFYECFYYKNFFKQKNKHNCFYEKKIQLKQKKWDLRSKISLLVL